MDSILLTPGPINVSFNVKKEMLYDYGSRDDHFLNNVKNIKDKLFNIFKIDTNNNLILLQGSGTYGIESVLSGVNNILLLINGEYGRRMKTILDKYHKKYKYLEFKEGIEIDYKQIEHNLNNIDYIAFVHLETSTGILNNLDKIKRIANKYNKKLIVDAIASFGSDIFDFNNISYLITSSNKCLQGVPGFTLIINSDNFDSYESQSYVLDIKDQHIIFSNTGQFRFTPPIHTLMAFSKALDELNIEKLEKRVVRYKNMKNKIYLRMERMGIKTFVDVNEFNTGNICHTFLYPDNDNFDFKKLYNGLKKFNYIIYPGKLTSINSFRIGSIGNIDENNIEQFLNYFENVLTAVLNNREFNPCEINCKELFDYLEKNDITFYSGVPDSLLQDFNSCILENSKNHHVVPNEGLALSIACGYYTATKKIPCVYLQNSGLGNMINPLLSLAHNNVYSIPCLIIIGWRGERGFPDEPQHISQGECMLNLINSMGFDTVILDKLNWKLNIDKCVSKINDTKRPIFLVVSKGLFQKYESKVKLNEFTLVRRDVLSKIVISSRYNNDILCCTTGKSSRELDEVSSENNINKSRLFLMVGSMGHVSSYALGVAMNTDKRVWCIDGDGSILMHLGSMPYIANIRPQNFIHILLNNAMHESVGIQPTIAQNIDFAKIASDMGYENCFTVKNDNELDEILIKIKCMKGLTFIHILMSNKSSNSVNLSRPKESPKERINNLIKYINTV